MSVTGVNGDTQLGTNSDDITLTSDVNDEVHNVPRESKEANLDTISKASILEPIGSGAEGSAETNIHVSSVLKLRDTLDTQSSTSGSLPGEGVIVKVPGLTPAHATDVPCSPLPDAKGDAEHIGLVKEQNTHPLNEDAVQEAKDQALERSPISVGSVMANQVEDNTKVVKDVTSTDPIIDASAPSVRDDNTAVSLHPVESGPAIDIIPTSVGPAVATQMDLPSSTDHSVAETYSVNSQIAVANAGDDSTPPEPTTVPAMEALAQVQAEDTKDANNEHEAHDNDLAVETQSQPVPTAEETTAESRSAEPAVLAEVALPLPKSTPALDESDTARAQTSLMKDSSERSESAALESKPTDIEQNVTEAIVTPSTLDYGHSSTGDTKDVTKPIEISTEPAGAELSGKLPEPPIEPDSSSELADVKLAESDIFDKDFDPVPEQSQDTTSHDAINQQPLEGNASRTEELATAETNNGAIDPIVAQQLHSNDLPPMATGTMENALAGDNGVRVGDRSDTPAIEGQGGSPSTTALVADIAAIPVTSEKPEWVEPIQTSSLYVPGSDVVETPLAGPDALNQDSSPILGVEPEHTSNHEAPVHQQLLEVDALGTEDIAAIKANDEPSHPTTSNQSHVNLPSPISANATENVPADNNLVDIVERPDTSVNGVQEGPLSVVNREAAAATEEFTRAEPTDQATSSPIVSTESILADLTSATETSESQIIEPGSTNGPSPDDSTAAGDAEDANAPSITHETEPILTSDDQPADDMVDGHSKSPLSDKVVDEESSTSDRIPHLSEDARPEHAEIDSVEASTHNRPDNAAIIDDGRHITESDSSASTPALAESLAPSHGKIELVQDISQNIDESDGAAKVEPFGDRTNLSTAEQTETSQAKAAAEISSDAVHDQKLETEKDSASYSTPEPAPALEASPRAVSEPNLDAEEPQAIAISDAPILPSEPEIANDARDATHAENVSSIALSDLTPEPQETEAARVAEVVDDIPSVVERAGVPLQNDEQVSALQEMGTSEDVAAHSLEIVPDMSTDNSSVPSVIPERDATKDTLDPSSETAAFVSSNSSSTPIISGRDVIEEVNPETVQDVSTASFSAPEQVQAEEVTKTGEEPQATKLQSSAEPPADQTLEDVSDKVPDHTVPAGNAVSIAVVEPSSETEKSVSVSTSTPAIDTDNVTIEGSASTQSELVSKLEHITPVNVVDASASEHPAVLETEQSSVPVSISPSKEQLASENISPKASTSTVATDTLQEGRQADGATELPTAVQQVSITNIISEEDTSENEPSDAKAVEDQLTENPKAVSLGDEVLDEGVLQTPKVPLLVEDHIDANKAVDNSQGCSDATTTTEVVPDVPHFGEQSSITPPTIPQDLRKSPEVAPETTLDSSTAQDVPVPGGQVVDTQANATEQSLPQPVPVVSSLDPQADTSNIRDVGIPFEQKRTDDPVESTVQEKKDIRPVSTEDTVLLAEAEAERPKSPWTPSFQVTTVGRGPSPEIPAINPGEDLASVAETEIAGGQSLEKGVPPIEEPSSPVTANTNLENVTSTADESSATNMGADKTVDQVVLPQLLVDSSSLNDVTEESESWTPSYSVHSQGSPRLPETKLENEAEAQESSRPWTPSYSVHSQGSPRPPEVELGSEAEARDSSRPWTPSYSVHSQGSPLPSRVELLQEQPSQLLLDEDTALAIDDLEEMKFAPNETVQPIADVRAAKPLNPNESLPEPQEMGGGPTTTDTATESPSKRDISVVIPAAETNAPPPALDREVPRLVMDTEERAAEVAPGLEPNRLEHTDDLTSVDKQSPAHLSPSPELARPASPRVLSYSVNIQGSPSGERLNPFEDPVARPDDIPEITPATEVESDVKDRTQSITPPATKPIPDLSVSNTNTEDNLSKHALDDIRQETASDDHHSPAGDDVKNVSIVTDAARLTVDSEDEQPSPWTPSYGVTVQGPGRAHEEVETALSKSSVTVGRPAAEEKDGSNDVQVAITQQGDDMLTAQVLDKVSDAADNDLPAARDADNGTSSTKTNDLRIDTVTETPIVDAPLASPDATSPVTARSRLESTASSRFFPGAWFSPTKIVDHGRASLEVAKGEFVAAKTSTSPPIDELPGTTAPETTVEGSSENQAAPTTTERKGRWCAIM